MNLERFTHAFKKLKVLVLATLSNLHDTSDDPYEIIFMVGKCQNALPVTIKQD